MDESAVFHPELIAPHEIEFDLIVATNVPSVRAVITLLPNLERPRWPKRGCYLPHVVVGDSRQREARMSGNTITEHYLGVLVADAPDVIPPGGSGRRDAAADVLAG